MANQTSDLKWIKRLRQGETFESSTSIPDGVALVQLNRPEARNALCPELLVELANTLHTLDCDATVRCMVLTGDQKAFAAGADIKAMASMQATDMLQAEWMDRWASIGHLKKPIIAAVNGYALGGGCELAMMCDMIFAGNKATFGQPEISIGVIPGAGGTQRLTRTVGKARAMELLLTGRPFTADEALNFGLITKICDPDATVTEALGVAENIASKPTLAVRQMKEAILEALNTPLEQGLQSERHRFSLFFGSADQQEGMAAFMEKRKPNWIW